MKHNQSYSLTTNLQVAATDLNTYAALDICRILTIAQQHIDRIIYRILGALDFAGVSVSAYRLDITGAAKLGDHVVFRSVSWADTEGGIEIVLDAYTGKDNSEVPIMNSSFVFTVATAVSEERYALS
jgi:hypothetical protein